MPVLWPESPPIADDKNYSEYSKAIKYANYKLYGLSTLSHVFCIPNRIHSPVTGYDSNNYRNSTSRAEIFCGRIEYACNDVN